MLEGKTVIKSWRDYLRIEVVAILLLIGVILGLFIPRFFSMSDQSVKQAHKTLYQLINTKLELYRANHGVSPKSMRSEDWNAESMGYTWVLYFPDGVPEQCPMGSAWKIDMKTGELQAHLHHE